ncbi:hypothetical protein ACHAXT_002532 [Thalassiosira profunda]
MNSEHIKCRRRRPAASLCAAALLSSSATAFTNVAPASCRRSNIALRSTVVQRYRIDNNSSDAAQTDQESDAFSFLPSRLSSIERMDTPSQFEKQVLKERISLTVVRFYSEVCPSCKATRPFFRKWARDIETGDLGTSGPQEDVPLPIKVVEMPLNRDTSSYLREELSVDKLPYCHLYHPEFGLVDEEVILNKSEFDDFVHRVDSWQNGGCDPNVEVDWGSEFDIEF